MDKRILIVDDDEALLEAVKMALEIEDYEVKTLSKSQEVLKIIKEFNPDLILLDYLLSGEDGRDVASRIRAMPHGKQVPIIMFSAHPNARNSLGKFGIDDFLPKPFDLDVLIDMVGKYTSLIKG